MKNRSLIRNWRRIEKLWSQGFTKFSLLSFSLSLPFFRYFALTATAPSPPHPLRLHSSPSFSALFREPLMTFSFSGLFRALSSLLLLCLSSTETSSLSLPTSFFSSPHLSPLILPALSCFIGDMAAVFLNLLSLPFPINLRVENKTKDCKPREEDSAFDSSFFLAWLLAVHRPVFRPPLNRNSFSYFERKGTLDFLDIINIVIILDLCMIN